MSKLSFFLTGFILSGFLFFGSNLVFGSGVQVNPLFDPVDPSTGLPIDDVKGKPRIYTQAEHDNTILYGKLEYIVSQLNQVQDTCSRKR